MNKRIYAIVLCICLLFSLVIPVLAEDEADPSVVIIRTSEDLAVLAENCRLDSYSAGITVHLQNNISLANADFVSIPIFQGTFLGNGHTISGLNIHGQGSSLGFFRQLGVDAIVQDLHLVGTVQPQGSANQVGSIAGINNGLIKNCTFRGSLAGQESIGGIAGVNNVTGIIEGCSSDGMISGTHFVGGLAGTNYGVVRSCRNTAQVNTRAQDNTVSLEDISLSSITNSEAANTVTDIGGIAGLSTGVIRDCENRANIGHQQMGYNIGGIAGTQSGTIIDCLNYGDIQGRKEVGGIVGQMEPVAFVQFSTDTFQILQQQLDTMSSLVGKATANAQSNASGAASNLGDLFEQVQTARDAVEMVIPDPNNPQMPDMDTLIAAGNTLRSTLGAMPGTVSSIASSVQSTVAGLSRDMQAVTRQMNAMGETLNEASETLGGSIEDISDQDTPEDLSGKVEGCRNYGDVHGDLSIGGIAGAIAMENDLDILEDWKQVGEESLNFDSQVRAVVLSCENYGQVGGKSQHIGGIAGWQSLGLVKGSVNYGTILAPTADYVGGIAGRSSGFIRSSNAKCRIDGHSCVGGIAGSATMAADCRSLVTMNCTGEKLGAILGIFEESETIAPALCNNLYYPVGSDLGAVDGVSYTGIAQPLTAEKFIRLDDIPDEFRWFHIRFVFEDGTEKVLPIAPGGRLNTRRIPAPPSKDGHEGYWDDLDEVDLSNITSDMTFHVSFIGTTPTIASVMTTDSGLPLLLVQGSFLPSETVEVTQSTLLPPEYDPETVNLCLAVTLNTEYAPEQGRVYSGSEQTQQTLLVCNSDGHWEQRAYTRNGSYLVFQIQQGDSAIALIEEASPPCLWIAAGVLAFAIVLVIILIAFKKRKTK